MSSKKEKLVSLHSRIEPRHMRFIKAQAKKHKLTQGEMVRVILDNNMFHNGAK